VRSVVRCGDVAGAQSSQRPHMAKPWDLTLTVDAAGHDTAHVRFRRLSPDGAHPHLSVRTGPLLIYCLDPRSVTDMASAWATAQVRAAHLLPVDPQPRPPSRTLGTAYPISEVVLEGRQRWTIAEPKIGQRELRVSVGWLSLRVHDRVALDTQVRAWAQASAFGGKVFGRRTPPFDHLLEQAQIAAVRDAARDHDRRVERNRRTRDT
jgi:hypothetical protein